MRVRVAAQGVGAAVIAMGVLLALAGTAGANHSIVERLSLGPTGGNGSNNAFLDHATPDGSRVLFHTLEPLVSEDTDSTNDIYERVNGTTTLITPPSIDGISTNQILTYMGASDDGAHVYFRTGERLLAGDLDNGGSDIYEAFAGNITLVSTGPLGGSDDRVPNVVGVSPDGERIYFKTRGRLVAEDADAGLLDVYEWSNGVTSLASTGDFAGGIASDILLTTAMSHDGATVYFETREQLEPQDLDTAYDLYARSGGVTTLVSTGPINGNGAFDVTLMVPCCGGSPEVSAQHVPFWTEEPLVTEDANGSGDLYESAGGTTVLVSATEAGSAGGADGNPFHTLASEDGTHVIFGTPTPLVSADMDSQVDLYERFGGQTRLVSTGPAGGNGLFDSPAGDDYASISPDGERIFFTTEEKLTADDTFDGCGYQCADLYERSGGTTTLISGGAGKTLSPNSYFAVDFSSAGDSRVIFDTGQRLVAADTDDQADAYERVDGDVSLLSPGNGLNGSRAVDVNGDGSELVLFTFDALTSTDTDTNADLYRLSAAPADAYPRPKGATPIYASLVPAYNACTSPVEAHAPPLAFGSCAPPAQASTQLTIGTPDANGQPAKATGFVKLKTVSGDVAITAGVADVRLRSDLSDYTGELRLSALVRATDKLNGPDPSPSGLGSGTVQDTVFGPSIPCATTADTTVGSNCSISTTVNTLIPGALATGARSVWQVGQLSVTDGGPDGDGDTTGDNSPFMVQGVFAP